MPLPVDGQLSWSDDLNDYLLGAAVEVQAELEGAVADAQSTIDLALAVLGGSAGLALDADGVPYFDPGIEPTPVILALLYDTDGVPYYYAGA